MATSKVDMSLDDIIAQNKARRGRGGRGGRGRGRGSSIGRGTTSFRGRGQSRGRGVAFRGNQRGGIATRRGGRQLRRGGVTQRRGGVTQRRGGVIRGTGIQSLRQRQQQAIQVQRQTARNTSMDAKRNLQGIGPLRGQRSQRGRGGLGRGGGIGRGRRPLVRPTAIQSGRGRGINRGRGMIRGTRTTIRRGGRGGIGARTAIQRVAAASVARARRRLQTQPTVVRQSQRGRGRGRQPTRIPRTLQQIQTPSDDPMQVSVISPTFQYDPTGIDLSPNFGSTHHTSLSLNSRFTPAGNRSNAQRIILPNGRAVEYQN